MARLISTQLPGGLEVRVLVEGTTVLCELKAGYIVVPTEQTAKYRECQVRLCILAASKATEESSVRAERVECADFDVATCVAEGTASRVA